MKVRWASGFVATNAYRARLWELITAGTRILHAGCGWDKNEISRPFKKKSLVVGVDVDPRVQSLFHSEFHLASLDALPFPADSFDTIFSEYVFEHLSDPERALREIHRVLRPGGSVLVLTPNYYSYKTIAARLTPQRFHVWMGRIRYGRGHEEDMYPTLFRCNTDKRFRTLAKRAGLAVQRVDLVTNGPTWFEKVPGLFGLFNVFHSAIERWSAARQLRCALIVELTKPGQATEAQVVRAATNEA